MRPKSWSAPTEMIDRIRFTRPGPAWLDLPAHAVTAAVGREIDHLPRGPTGSCGTDRMARRARIAPADHGRSRRRVGEGPPPDHRRGHQERPDRARRRAAAHPAAVDRRPPGPPPPHRDLISANGSPYEQIVGPTRPHQPPVRPAGPIGRTTNTKEEPMSMGDKIKNAAEETVGKIKETAGKVTGNEELEARGTGRSGRRRTSSRPARRPRTPSRTSSASRTRPPPRMRRQPTRVAAACALVRIVHRMGTTPVQALVFPERTPGHVCHLQIAVGRERDYCVRPESDRPAPGRPRSVVHHCATEPAPGRSGTTHASPPAS